MTSGTKKLLVGLAGIGLAGGVLVTTASRWEKPVDRTDFGMVRTATTPAWDARLAAVSSAPIKEFRIPGAVGQAARTRNS
ncbi:MAG: hypothetical protein ACT4PM_03780 [Gemmatimonadales bacterium]